MKKLLYSHGEAALYNIPEKRNNGDMDLPFLGNMGYGGEDKMIEKIKNLHGYEILIKEPPFWQESTKIIEYIKNNYEKIGDICDFQIYYIK